MVSHADYDKAEKYKYITKYLRGCRTVRKRRVRINRIDRLTPFALHCNNKRIHASLGPNHHSNVTHVIQGTPLV